MPGLSTGQPCIRARKARTPAAPRCHGRLVRQGPFAVDAGAVPRPPRIRLHGRGDQPLLRVLRGLHEGVVAGDQAEVVQVPAGSGDPAVERGVDAVAALELRPGTAALLRQRDRRQPPPGRSGAVEVARVAGDGVGLQVDPPIPAAPSSIPVARFGSASSPPASTMIGQLTPSPSCMAVSSRKARGRRATSSQCASPVLTYIRRNAYAAPAAPDR